MCDVVCVTVFCVTDLCATQGRLPGAAAAAVLGRLAGSSGLADTHSALRVCLGLLEQVLISLMLSLILSLILSHALTHTHNALRVCLLEQVLSLVFDCCLTVV